MMVLSKIFKNKLGSINWVYFALMLVGLIFSSGPTLAQANTQTATVTSKSIKDISPQQRRKINVAMPQVQGLNNVQIQSKINHDLKDKIDQLINDFKEHAAKSDVDAHYQNSLDIHYTVVGINQKRLSLLLETEEYFTHMAHPDNQIYTFNFALQTGESLKLDDLFQRDKSACLNQIANFATADLLTRIPELYGYAQEKVPPQNFDTQSAKNWIIKGSAATSENYKHFGLQQDELIIYFAAYQVVPRPNGVVKVAIPFAKLNCLNLP